jgi:LysR family glycine cleavage system transcriptional activator
MQKGRLVFPFAGLGSPAWRYCSYVCNARLKDHAINIFLAWLRDLGQRFSQGT